MGVNILKLGDKEQVEKIMGRDNRTMGSRAPWLNAEVGAERLAWKNYRAASGIREEDSKTSKLKEIERLDGDF